MTGIWTVIVYRQLSRIRTQLQPMPRVRLKTECSSTSLSWAGRGSTAGTLLAKHGWNVAIFEKEKFPRFKIGESLLPGSLRTFERMGVKEKIDKADVFVKYGVKICFRLYCSNPDWNHTDSLRIQTG